MKMAQHVYKESLVVFSIVIVFVIIIIIIIIIFNIDISCSLYFFNLKCFFTNSGE